MTEKALCIIPARGGSRRIPRKNVLPLNGIPLLCYSIRAVQQAQVFSEIIVSSEDEEIQALALSEGVQIDARPTEMAGDQVTKVQVVKEYIERTHAAASFRYVAVLLPTCPFRTSADIKNAFDLLTSQQEHKFLISVTEYDFPIQLALKKKGENVVEMAFENGYKTTRSQDIKKMYHPNGAIYLAEINAFIEKGTFFNEEMMAYFMPALRSFDIDYPYQFELAQIIAKNIHQYEQIS